MTAKILPLRQRIRVYLAGPMRGRVDGNFPAFFAAAAELRALGYEVVSPAEHDVEEGYDPTAPGGDLMPARQALAWDLLQVLAADAVVVLPGWATSAGTAAEVATARAVGTPVLELVEILEHGAAVAA